MKTFAVKVHVREGRPVTLWPSVDTLIRAGGVNEYVWARFNRSQVCSVETRVWSNQERRWAWVTTYESVAVAS
jgi:hypothetical protein